MTFGLMVVLMTSALTGCKPAPPASTTVHLPDEEVLLISLFERVIIPPNGNAIGPAGAVDLTGFKEYRLVLRLQGAANAPYKINELYGPAGGIDQLNVDIDDGVLSSFGHTNYRKKFDVYGPKAFKIRVFNLSGDPMTVNGSLYAVE